MKNKRTPREYDLKRWRENRVRYHGINKDDFYVMKFIYPLLWSLLLIGISQNDVKDYVGLFKAHSQKGKKAPGSNTRMMIRIQFKIIFKYLFEKIGKPALPDRIFDRINNYERNII